MLIISQSEETHPLSSASCDTTGEWLRWPVHPAGLVLDEETVHVWSFPLRIPSRVRPALQQILPPDEQERATAPYNQAIRDRFLAARVCLRQILGHFLACSPCDVRLEYGAQGKPMLVVGENVPALSFNLSHSGDVGLVAIGVNRDIGVDHERRQRVADDLGISERFFSRAESQYLHSLDPSQRGTEFLKLWTCKEAYVKATGLGLSCPLNSFNVVFSSDGQTGVIVRIGDSKARSGHAVQVLPLSSKFVGAVVSAGQNWQLKCWRWPNRHA